MMSQCRGNELENRLEDVFMDVWGFFDTISVYDYWGASGVVYRQVQVYVREVAGVPHRIVEGCRCLACADK